MKYRVDKVNAWNGWDPLKQIILGNCYSPDWFSDVKDKSLRSMIQTLVRETQEDLDGVQRTLEDLGVDVVRIPENTVEDGTNLNKYGIDSYGKYLQYINDTNSGAKRFWKNGLPKPMITPRDYFITLGDKFVQTIGFSKDNPLSAAGLIDPALITGFTRNKKQEAFEKAGFVIPGPLKYSTAFIAETFPNWIPDWDNLEWADYKSYNKAAANEDYHTYCHNSWGFWAPMVTRVGDTLVVDVSEQENLADYLLAEYPEFKQSHVAIGGHNDGAFCTPKPGLVVNAFPEDTEGYKKTFPNWDIFNIPNMQETDDEFHEFMKFKDKVDGRWWQKGAEAQPAYVDFVEKWMGQWVGYVEETIFEVNMLSIDPETILCLNRQDVVHDALKSRGINPIYTRFRHRKFWDGGLHCLTVDTVRDGDKQNYYD